MRILNGCICRYNPHESNRLRIFVRILRIWKKCLETLNKNRINLNKTADIFINSSNLRDMKKIKKNSLLRNLWGIMADRPTDIPTDQERNTWGVIGKLHFQTDPVLWWVRSARPISRHLARRRGSLCSHILKNRINWPLYHWHYEMN